VFDEHSPAEASPVVSQLAATTEKVEVQPVALPAAVAIVVRPDPVAELPVVVAPLQQVAVCKPATDKVAEVQCAVGVCKQGPKLGTVLGWTNSLAEASRRALKEDKLIFLIHVSGNFADPGFT